MFALQIAYREPNEEDIDFIYNSFIKSISNQKPWQNIDRNMSSACLHSLLTKLLYTSNILIAISPTDAEQIYGYIVWKDRTLHYIYTKYDFRKAGVGKRLMLEAFNNFDEHIVYTIDTVGISYLIGKWNLRYNSYVLGKLGSK